MKEDTQRLEQIRKMHRDFVTKAAVDLNETLDRHKSNFSVFIPERNLAACALGVAISYVNHNIETNKTLTPKEKDGIRKELAQAILSGEAPDATRMLAAISRG